MRFRSTLIAILLSQFICSPANAVTFKEAETPESLEAKVRKFEKGSDNQAAIAVFENRSSDLQPTAATYRYVGLAYFGDDNFEKSAEYAKLALALDPDDETAANLALFSAKVLGDFEGGDALAKVWMKKPRAKETLRHIAIFYTKWDRYEESLAATSLGIKRLPKDQRMAGVHAYALTTVEGKDAVLAFQKKWARKNKPGSYFWENVAKGLVEIDEHEEAIPFFQKAVDLEPSDADLASQVLSAYRGYKAYDDGIAWGLAWEKQALPNAEFQKMLGVLYFVKPDYPAAAQRFRQALALDPSNTVSLVNLIVTHIETKDYQEAVDVGTKWRESQPDRQTDRFNFYFANALSYTDRYADAEPHYRRAIKQAPQKTEYIDELAKALNMQGKHQDALDFVAVWQKEHPDAKNADLDEQIEIATKGIQLANRSAADIAADLINSF